MAERPKQKIASGVGCVLLIPKCHQVDGIAAIAESLGSTLTGKLDQEELAVVIWILTRIRPDFRISELRCEHFEEVHEKYKQAALRLKTQSPAKYRLIVTKIQTFLAEDEEDNILRFAIDLGFDPGWLSTSNKKVKKLKASARMKSIMTGKTESSASGVQPDLVGAAESEEQIKETTSYGNGAASQSNC